VKIIKKLAGASTPTSFIRIKVNPMLIKLHTI